MATTIETVLAECLRAVERGEMTPQECLAKYPAHREELKPLLDTAHFLQRVPPVKPDQFYRSTSRTRLMNQVKSSYAQRQREKPTEPAPSQNTAWVEKLVRLPLQPTIRWVFSSLALLLLLAFGVFQSSSGALPGDKLYSFKAGVERTRFLVSGDSSKVEFNLQSARNRLEEMEALAAKGRFDDLTLAEEHYQAFIEAARGDLLELSQQGSPEAEAMTMFLNDTLDDHSQRLNELLQLVPDSSKEGIQRAINVSKPNVSSEDLGRPSPSEQVTPSP